MKEYRFYRFSSDNHITGVPVVFACGTDNDAIAEACKLLDGPDIEVWESVRRVIRLNAIEAR